MTYSQAIKSLVRTGTAHATGDSLRAMYARLLPWHVRLNNSSIGRFYAHFQGFTTDRAVADEARRLLREPLEACAVVFGGNWESIQ